MAGKRDSERFEKAAFFERDISHKPPCLLEANYIAKVALAYRSETGI